MKLEEIAKKSNGTYAAVKYSKKSLEKIKKICEELKLDNRVVSDKIHTTLIYSRTPAPELKANQDLYPVYAQVTGFTIFKTQDNKNALVLKLDCPELVNRHKEIMETHNTTYDFPEYIPHITICYDCGDDFDYNSYTGEFPRLEVVEEYVEDLVLDWQNKK